MLYIYHRSKKGKPPEKGFALDEKTISQNY
jgi:hypothetical protein